MPRRELTRPTEEELEVFARISGVPLIYVMKFDTYNLLNNARIKNYVYHKEFERVKSESGEEDRFVLELVAAHFKVSTDEVMAANIMFKKAKTKG